MSLVLAFVRVGMSVLIALLSLPLVTRDPVGAGAILARIVVNALAITHRLLDTGPSSA